MQKELPFKETLLVSDMDGTLITDKFEMPERNIEAVRLFIEGGGHFAFSTGRTVFSAGAFFDRVRVNAPCILYNGAVLFDYSKAEFLWSADLPESVFELCSAAIQRFPDLGAEVMTDDAVYIIQVNVSTRRHIINESIHYLMRDLADVPRTGAHKIIFTGEADELQQALQFVERQPNGGWDFVFSSPNFLEILPQNVSKGTTLVRLANYLHIKPEHTFAIGDYYNDLTLLKKAAFSGTPANSPEELKKAADVVVGPCEQGAVADFIDILSEKFAKA